MTVRRNCQYGIWCPRLPIWQMQQILCQTFCLFGNCKYRATKNVFFLIFFSCKADIILYNQENERDKMKKQIVKNLEKLGYTLISTRFGIYGDWLVVGPNGFEKYFSTLGSVKRFLEKI